MKTTIDPGVLYRAAALSRAVRDGRLMPMDELMFRRLVDMVLLSEGCRVIDNAHLTLQLGYATWPGIRNRFKERGLITLIPQAEGEAALIAVPLVDASLDLHGEGRS